MNIHSIHVAVTRKVYLDIWRNIKKSAKLVFSYSIFRRYILPKGRCKVMLWKLSCGEGAYYYFIREDNTCIFFVDKTDKYKSISLILI